MGFVPLLLAGDWCFFLVYFSIDHSLALRDDAPFTFLKILSTPNLNLNMNLYYVVCWKSLYLYRNRYNRRRNYQDKDDRGLEGEGRMEARDEIGGIKISHLCFPCQIWWISLTQKQIWSFYLSNLTRLLQIWSSSEKSCRSGIREKSLSFQLRIRSLDTACNRSDPCRRRRTDWIFWVFSVYQQCWIRVFNILHLQYFLVNIKALPLEVTKFHFQHNGRDISDLHRWSPMAPTRLNFGLSMILDCHYLMWIGRGKVFWIHCFANSPNTRIILFGKWYIPNQFYNNQMRQYVQLNFVCGRNFSIWESMSCAISSTVHVFNDGGMGMAKFIIQYFSICNLNMGNYLFGCFYFEHCNWIHMNNLKSITIFYVFYCGYELMKYLYCLKYSWIYFFVIFDVLLLINQINQNYGNLELGSLDLKLWELITLLPCNALAFTRVVFMVAISENTPVYAEKHLSIIHDYYGFYFSIGDELKTPCKIFAELLDAWSYAGTYSVRRLTKLLPIPPLVSAREALSIYVYIHGLFCYSGFCIAVLSSFLQVYRAPSRPSTPFL